MAGNTILITGSPAYVGDTKGCGLIAAPSIRQIRLSNDGVRAVNA